MRQLGLFAAAFGGTLAVLLLAFLALQGMADGSRPTPTMPAFATASPTPPAGGASPIRPTPVATAGQTPDPGASATSSGAPTPTPGGETPGTTPTAGPTDTPGPTVGPGGRLVLTLLGVQYESAVVAPNATLIKRDDGSILLVSRRGQSDTSEVHYRLPASALPPASQIVRIDTLVCGEGSGDFWETYGPDGSSPAEHEAIRPAVDGCWHYDDAPGPDTSVTGMVRTQTTLRIDRIVYTITVR